MGAEGVAAALFALGALAGEAVDALAPFGLVGRASEIGAAATLRTISATTAMTTSPTLHQYRALMLRSRPSFGPPKLLALPMALV